MKLGMALAALACACVALCVGVGGVAWVLLWPALSFGVAAAGYLGVGPRVLGKQRDGTLARWSYALNGPFLAWSWLGWWLLVRSGRENPCDEVAPDIYVGRRPTGDVIPREVLVVVDMTAEFTELEDVMFAREYHLCATLDGRAPDPDAFVDLIDALVDDEAPVLIHCAAGHGRSATVAAALILARGLAETPEDAEAMMRTKRPGVRLNAEQRALLRAWANGDLGA